MTRKRIHAVTAAMAAPLLLAGLHGAPAAADDYYKGKRLTMMIGSSTGGGYDVYGRMVANHFGNNIPGKPRFIVKNMPGAGGLKVVDYLYNVAPRDATHFGAVQRGALFEPLLGSTGISYDVLNFGWLGSTNSETGVVVSAKGSPIQKVEDIFSKTFIVGSTGPASDTTTVPLAYSALLDARFKLINGYNGMGDIVLAAQRGELHGAGDWSWSNVKTQAMQQVKSGELILLMQSGLKRHPELPDVPLALDFAKDDETRKVLELLLARKTLGRPFLVTPGTPETRLKMLQASFMATMDDPAFLAEATRLKRDLDPVSGAEIEAALERIYSASPEMIARAKAAITPPDLQPRSAPEKSATGGKRDVSEVPTGSAPRS